MMRPLARFVVGALSLAGSLFAGAAGASQRFPGQLRKAIDAQCAPTCLLCHTSPEGGIATIRLDRPTTLKYREIADKYDDSAKLMAAITALGETTDSDMDGFTDLQELKEGSDPWVSGNDSQCDDLPQYGCGARIAEHPPTESGHTPEYLLAAGIALVLLQRRARKRS